MQNANSKLRNPAAAWVCVVVVSSGCSREPIQNTATPKSLNEKYAEAVLSLRDAEQRLEWLEPSYSGAMTEAQDIVCREYGGFDYQALRQNWIASFGTEKGVKDRHALDEAEEFVAERVTKEGTPENALYEALLSKEPSIKKYIEQEKIVIAARQQVKDFRQQLTNNNE